MSCQHPLRGRIQQLEYGSYLAYTPKPVNKKTEDAYELMKAIKNNRMLDEKTNIIDEIIIRGHTVLGAAWRVAEAYPGARIFAFALMRTVSDTSKFKSLYDPVLGKISFRPATGDAIRRP